MGGVPYCSTAQFSRLTHLVANDAPLSPIPTDSIIYRSDTAYKLAWADRARILQGRASIHRRCSWNGKRPM